MKRSYLICIIIFFQVSALCQSRDTASLNSVRSAIIKLSNDPDLKHATLSFCLTDITSGKQLVAYDEFAACVPASSLKLLTTAASLATLGPDYRFETHFEYEGNISDKGVLEGNIFIRGGGDPSLGSERFGQKNALDELVEILIKKGITKIEGSVFGDASYYDEHNVMPSGWIWADMGNYYGAFASGLTYKENKFDLLFNSKAAGDSTVIASIKPMIPGMQVINKVVAGGSSDNAYIYGAPYQSLRIVSGTIPANRTNYDVSGAVPDPALFCAFELVEKLNKKGIIVMGGAKTTFNLPGNKLGKSHLFTAYSPSLKEIVKVTNIKSHNLFAEHLLKSIGLKQKDVGSDWAGANAVKEYWESKGVNMEGVILNDGCGLSRLNIINSKQLSEILAVSYNESWFPDLYASLPVYSPKIRLKSGYMTRVRSYAGYINGKENKYGFAVIVNNYDCSAQQMRRKLDEILELLKFLD